MSARDLRMIVSLGFYVRDNGNAALHGSMTLNTTVGLSLTP